MAISDSESDVSSGSTGSEGLSDSSQLDPPPSSEIPRCIANWWLNDKLGAGYSGSIFRATHLHTRQIVALKVQYVNHECPTNRYERHLYPLLQGGKGMPRLWASGVQGEWDYLAIDLLGASLDSLYRKSGKDTMDLRSVCSIAMQLISRLELMHTRGVLHRDIQLGNCVVGLPPNEGTIYMIDFGFSKRYIDPYTNRHIPNSNAKRDFIGNYWFSSVNVHCRGRVPSRRDDLEAAALMLIHLLTPRGLSWTRNGVPKTSEAHNRLKAEKKAAQPEDLCKGMPVEFEDFLKYCRRLKFKDRPDYSQWIEHFRALAVEEGFPASEDFIWPPPSIDKPVHPPRHARTAAVKKDDLADILNDLAKLNMGARQILGDRTNVEDVVKHTKADAKLNSGQRSEPITISSGSESDTRVNLMPKAYQLNQLAEQVSKATDNPAISQLVRQFIGVLKINSSRTLTREAFHFLDKLYKQLDDPSVFIKAKKTSQTRSFSEQVPEREPSHVKLGVVARLRQEVQFAPNNKALASMVADFAKITNKSTGRTVTKDGFAFLEGLSERLKFLP
ncbi:hypothetical protein K443DRAFT_672843 [Laccaria amethystina LaAM-08-1]|uniref:Protein kinase domain-containing protein n=1 Tax=Laccaria amethystina LaAM-08-1 TaxID=1095629 RepID=A0A0C9XSQ6_9AGAR|nr:hypothetical protein K443DRAFT_672843 [Laccaria amethystina LaAM-08-1]